MLKVYRYTYIYIYILNIDIQKYMTARVFMCLVRKTKQRQHI